MAGTVESPQHQRQNILNSDGKPHPVENILRSSPWLPASCPLSWA